MRSLLVVVAVLVGCGEAASPLDRTAAPASLGLADREAYCRRVDTVQRFDPGAAGALGTQQGSLVRPAHTFSIVARDPVTGDLGVAVQSHWFSVGSQVTWAEPGVGAVATQSFVEPAYGPKGLALMAAGASAPDAMAKLVADDAHADVRQLGFVDAQGRAASHTGAHCIAYARSQVGAGYAVQSNLMGTDAVTPAMAHAFETATGDLASRVLAALAAGQAVGGDIRGCQSAAILVVSGTKSATPWTEKKLDLRVEDSPAPIEELARLVTLARAYDHMNQGDLAVEKNDMPGAIAHYSAAAGMTTNNIEMLYWQAISLADHGDVERAIPILRTVYRDDPRWIELTRRLPASDLLHDPAVIARLHALESESE